MRRICPDCDAMLVEETAGIEMISQRSRYCCHDCGTRWRWAPVGMLIEDEG